MLVKNGVSAFWRCSCFFNSLWTAIVTAAWMDCMTWGQRCTYCMKALARSIVLAWMLQIGSSKINGVSQQYHRRVQWNHCLRTYCNKNFRGWIAGFNPFCQLIEIRTLGYPGILATILNFQALAWWNIWPIALFRMPAPEKLFGT